MSQLYLQSIKVIEEVACADALAFARPDPVSAIFDHSGHICQPVLMRGMKHDGKFLDLRAANTAMRRKDLPARILVCLSAGKSARQSEIFGHHSWRICARAALLLCIGFEKSVSILLFCWREGRTAMYNSPGTCGNMSLGVCDREKTLGLNGGFTLPADDVDKKEVISKTDEGLAGREGAKGFLVEDTARVR